MGMQNPSTPPKRGLGRSDGGKGVPKEFQGQETETGTFSLFKNFGVLKTLKFDHRARLQSSETAVAVAA